MISIFFSGRSWFSWCPCLEQPCPPSFPFPKKGQSFCENTQPTTMVLFRISRLASLWRPSLRSFKYWFWWVAVTFLVPLAIWSSIILQFTGRLISMSFLALFIYPPSYSFHTIWWPCSLDSFVSLPLNMAWQCQVQLWQFCLDARLRTPRWRLSSSLSYLYHNYYSPVSSSARILSPKPYGGLSIYVLSPVSDFVL